MRAAFVATIALLCVAYVAGLTIDIDTEAELSHPILPALGSGCLPHYARHNRFHSRHHKRTVKSFGGVCVKDAACTAERSVPGYCAGEGTVCCKNAPAAPAVPAAKTAFAVLTSGATATCTSAGGVCKDKSTCAAPSTTKSGLCPGAANIMCCVPPASSTPATPAPTPAAPATGVAAITGFADASQCSKRSWTGRGTAPKSFIRGLAVSFAKAVCQPTRADVVFVGNSALGSNDALNWYGSILKQKLGPTSSGITTVRQLYTLLAGLGMRESSGQYCVGRDMSASFSSASTAEAGLFQTSYGAHTRSTLMDGLFSQYKGSKAGCAYSIYTPGVKCSASNLKNWGATSDQGYVWQQLTKDCPSFATEYAAVLLRLNGGSKGEWGPLRTKAAEVVPECYSMFGQVQSYVAANSATICPLVNALA